MRRGLMTGVLALGIAAFMAGPVFAQQGGAAGGGNAPAQSGAQSGAQPSAPASNAPATNAPATNAPSSSAETPHAKSATHASAHHAMHRARHAAARSTDTGDEAVARLNEMSLQAAQQGQTFNPPAATK